MAQYQSTRGHMWRKQTEAKNNVFKNIPIVFPSPLTLTLTFTLTLSQRLALTSANLGNQEKC